MLMCKYRVMSGVIPQEPSAHFSEFCVMQRACSEGLPIQPLWRDALLVLGAEVQGRMRLRNTSAEAGEDGAVEDIVGDVGAAGVGLG